MEGKMHEDVNMVSENISNNKDVIISETTPELIGAEGVWFSYMEKRWDTEGKWARRTKKFFWTGQVDVWDYKNCNISFARASDDELKVVVRREEEIDSEFMHKFVSVRRMIGFDLKRVYKPKTDIYTARENEKGRNVIEGPKKRWVFQFNDNCWIWEWAKDGQDIGSSNVYRLYNSLCTEIDIPTKSDNHFEATDIKDTGQDDRIIPIIYQPAVDCMKNFLREIHCSESKTAKGYKEIEVSLIFNNEQLRKNLYLNNIYELYRYYRYGRTADIETFRIRLKQDEKNDTFVFHNIYSGKYDLEYDSIHGDSGENIPEHKIKYYFKNRKHPVIFINTSNHAMAESDTNHELWKWEYIPWADMTPVKLGEMNRNEIEEDIEWKITKQIDGESFYKRSIHELVQKYRRVKRLPL
ncbi:hypothetical protein [Methanolobus sp. WCC4]|uniref:hypothetical protein n=1 Tax=Methanolobus sp. WCC4 TaxID=3125784 RepID=UPI0030F4D6B5